jgi:molybdopterin/thiamine biosynthesis adenylyltransferase
MTLRVFIHGITGVVYPFIQLGVEVAKNLILAGPKQVTIYDPNLVTIEDVGRNFYCREDQVGKLSRA